MGGEKNPPFMASGCSYAVKQIWTAKDRMDAAQSKQTGFSNPWDANECLYRLFDTTNVPFSYIAFNEAGSVMAALASQGIIRLIGLKTMCVYASISVIESFPQAMKKPHVNEALYLQTENVASIKFFDWDTKLAVVFHDVLFVYTLGGASPLECVAQLSLALVVERLTEQPLRYIKNFDTNADLCASIIPSTCYETSCTIGTTSCPPVTPFPDEHTLSDEEMSTIKEVFRTGDCLILQYKKSRSHTADSSQEHQIDVVMHNQDLSSVPLRFVWCLDQSKFSSVECLVPPNLLSFTDASFKTCRFVSTVFATCHFEWRVYMPFSESGVGSDSIVERIRRYNTSIAESQRAYSEEYSIWNGPGSLYPRCVLCAVGTPQGQILLLYLFRDAKIPSRVVGCVNLKIARSPISQLVPNRSGSVLYCRSTENLFVLRIGVKATTQSLENDDARQSEESKNVRENVHEISFEYATQHRQLIHRERSFFIAVSNSPSNTEVILLLSGKKDMIIHILALVADCTALQVMRSIHLSKFMGITQIAWVPGSFSWGAVSPRERCVLFFGLKPPTDMWHKLLPNFLRLTENIEVVESETEFDRKTPTCAPNGLLFIKRSRHLSASQNNPDGMHCWFTTANPLATAIHYSFLAPTLPEEHILETQAPDKDNEHIRYITTNAASLAVYRKTIQAFLSTSRNS